MSKARWPHETVARLRALRGQGLTWEIIGERLGRTPDACRQRFHHGCQPVEGATVVILSESALRELRVILRRLVRYHGSERKAGTAIGIGRHTIGYLLGSDDRSCRKRTFDQIMEASRKMRIDCPFVSWLDAVGS